MDVRCGRCGTEYEFDDALDLGARHDRQVHELRPSVQSLPDPNRSGVPERWVVRTTSGRELVYTSLRDLQKGITQRQVGPEDMLSPRQPARRDRSARSPSSSRFFKGPRSTSPSTTGDLARRGSAGEPGRPAERPRGSAPPPPHATLVGGFDRERHRDQWSPTLRRQRRRWSRA